MVAMTPIEALPLRCLLLKREGFLETTGRLLYGSLKYRWHIRNRACEACMMPPAMLSTKIATTWQPIGEARLKLNDKWQFTSGNNHMVA